MKKTTIILIAFLFSIIAFGQSNEEPCITCDGNKIDFTKGASAISTQNECLGINSFAVGYLNEAHGDYSIAMPFLARSSGARSIALGYNANANGMGSLALGTHSHTGENAVLSVAIGSLVSASANWSMVLGLGSGDSLLTNRKQNSFMVGFNSNRPTFFVSPSDGIGTTGKIGIGNVTSPEAKLHIRADETENAVIKLETTGANQYAQLVLADDDHTITTTPGGSMTFQTTNAGDFKFNNGNVEINERLGIGTNDPQTKVHVKAGDIFIDDIDHGIVMKSPDGNCWRGTLNNDGQLQFVQVDCNDILTHADEIPPAAVHIVNIYPNPAQDLIQVETVLCDATMQIFDAQGRPVHSEKLQRKNLTIDVSGFRPGTYVYTISNRDGEIEHGKFIKQ